METVKGYVEHIVFRNEDNGYTVFNLNNDDGDLTCVGQQSGKFANNSLFCGRAFSSLFCFGEVH